MSIFKEIWDMGKELSTILKDSKKELDEILTDGFVEMVVKGNSDYKTSFEKNDMASDIVYSAKKSYENKLIEVKNNIESAEIRITKNNDRKLELAKRLHNETKISLENFEKHIIKKYMVKSTDKSLDSISNLAKLIQNGAGISLSAVSAINPIGLLGGSLLLSNIEKRGRVNTANETLEDARLFRDKMDLEINQLDLLGTKVVYINKVIDEEEQLFEKLSRKLEYMTKKLSSYLDMSEITDEMANEAEQLYKMTALMSDFINTNFVDNNLEVTKKYQEMLNKIKIEVN